MTSDMNFDRIDELIALAALGELSAEDQRELDAVVRTDPVVAAEVDEALAAAAALQRSHAEEPPPALRSSVLAAIASTPQDASTDRGVTSLDVERRRRRFGPLLAAAAAVMFAIGGVVVVVNDDGGSDPIAAVVDAADATTRGLSGEIDSLSVTFSRSERALVVEGDGIPVPESTATYQLWLVGDDGATSVGTFRPGDDGAVEVRFDEVDPTDFVLGVTEEPAGGSESPTLPILASA